jgi:hypothetical protein
MTRSAFPDARLESPMQEAHPFSQADTAGPGSTGWTALDPGDPRAARRADWEQAINVELTLFRHALPADDKRSFFRSAEEAQELVERAVKGLPPGIRARIASIHAVRSDLEREAAAGGVFLYFRAWGLLVEFQRS